MFPLAVASAALRFQPPARPYASSHQRGPMLPVASAKFKGGPKEPSRCCQSAPFGFHRLVDDSPRGLSLRIGLQMLLPPFSALSTPLPLLPCTRYIPLNLSAYLKYLRHAPRFASSVSVPPPRPPKIAGGYRQRECLWTASLPVAECQRSWQTFDG